MFGGLELKLELCEPRQGVCLRGLDVLGIEQPGLPRFVPQAAFFCASVDVIEMDRVGQPDLELLDIESESIQPVLRGELLRQ